MIVLLPVIVLVVGLLMYALATHSKIAEIGRIMFWTGLLAALLQGARFSIG